MRSHSDHLTWQDNWEYLLRCFPSVAKAPSGALEQFHARGANLRQDWLREAITMAVNKVAKRSLTLEQLLNFYEAVQPTEPMEADCQQTEAKVFAYWVFPAKFQERCRRHWTESAARADMNPGDTLQVQYTRPGERSWIAPSRADESPELTFDQQREVFASIYGLIAKTIDGRESTYERLQNQLLLTPPLEPPLEGSTRASEQAASVSERSATSRTPNIGGLSTPPLKIREVDGMHLPVHQLPTSLARQFLEAYEVLAGQDSTAPEGSARLPAEGVEG